MMSKWAAVVVGDKGQIIHAFGKPIQEHEEGVVILFDPPEVFDPTKVYFPKGVRKDIPEAPEGINTFDHETHQWVSAEVFSPEELQFKARTALNNLVSDARRPLISTVVGQDYVLVLKKEEAKSYLMETAPNLKDYPLIDAEVGFTGDTPNQVIQVWLNLANQAALAFAQIEKAKLGVISYPKDVDKKSALEQLVKVMRGRPL